MTWLPVIALPNIDVHCRVEGRLAAVVRYYDKRLVTLRREHPVLKQFLNRFKDAFRQIQRPSVLILRQDAPTIYRNPAAISGFRDLFSMSVVPYNRAAALQHPRTSQEVLFANSFAFYPWMVDNRNEGLTTYTPAVLGNQDIDKFTPQCNPETPYKAVTRLDEPLLSTLIERWEIRFGTDDPSGSDRALFRSLNMAYQAAQMPFTTAGTIYDIGRLVALWVSAFEILAHSGAGGYADKFQVWRVLSGYPANWKPYKGMRAATLRQTAYQHIYSARNAYLHGNPVEDSQLFLKGSSGDLSRYASVLYRLMLAEYLKLHHKLPDLSKADPLYAKKFGTAVAEYIEFNGYQREYERALATIKGPNKSRRTVQSIRSTRRGA